MADSPIAKAHGRPAADVRPLQLPLSSHAATMYRRPKGRSREVGLVGIAQARQALADAVRRAEARAEEALTATRAA